MKSANYHPRNYLPITKEKNLCSEEHYLNWVIKPVTTNTETIKYNVPADIM